MTGTGRLSGPPGAGLALLAADRLQQLCDRAKGGLIGGCRAIGPDDERALRPGERAHLHGAVAAVRCASGAARIVARELVARLGGGDAELPRLPGSAPRWPDGFVGSMAHDRAMAVAVAARHPPFRSIGVDVEPAEPLAAGLTEIVATPGERAWLGGDPLATHLLFCIKEAVYKATHRLDGEFLDYQDVEYSPETGTAVTGTGHRLEVHADASVRLLALAVLR